jgi:hypothetical protein
VSREDIVAVLCALHEHHDARHDLPSTLAATPVWRYACEVFPRLPTAPLETGH